MSDNLVDGSIYSNIIIFVRCEQCWLYDRIFWFDLDLLIALANPSFDEVEYLFSKELLLFFILNTGFISGMLLPFLLLAVMLLSRYICLHHVHSIKFQWSTISNHDKVRAKMFFISNDLKSHAHQLLRKTWHNFGILTAHIITSFHTLLRNIENISLIIWSKKEYHTQYLNIIKISVVNKKGISLLGSVMQKLEKWMYNFWRSINNCLLLVVLWHLK